MNHKNSNKSDLSHELFQLYLTLRTEKKKEWNRILPFNELLIDRWEKAKFLKTKKGSSIYDNSYIFGDVKHRSKSSTKLGKKKGLKTFEKKKMKF